MGTQVSQVFVIGVRVVDLEARGLGHGERQELLERGGDLQVGVSLEHPFGDQRVHRELRQEPFVQFGAFKRRKGLGNLPGFDPLAQVLEQFRLHVLELFVAAAPQIRVVKVGQLGRHGVQGETEVRLRIFIEVLAQGNLRGPGFQERGPGFRRGPTS